MELLLIDGEGRFNNAGKASLPQLGRADGSGAWAHPHMCEQGGALVAAGEAALKIEISYCLRKECYRAGDDWEGAER